MWVVAGEVVDPATGKRMSDRERFWSPAALLLDIDMADGIQNAMREGLLAKLHAFHRPQDRSLDQLKVNPSTSSGQARADIEDSRSPQQTFKQLSWKVHHSAVGKVWKVVVDFIANDLARDGH